MQSLSLPSAHRPAPAAVGGGRHGGGLLHVGRQPLTADQRDAVLGWNHSVFSFHPGLYPVLCHLPPRREDIYSIHCQDPVLRPVRNRAGHVSCGHVVCRTPPLTDQWLHLPAGQDGLCVQTGSNGPNSPHLHLPGRQRLRGSHRDAGALLPAPDRAEPGPGAGVRAGGLRHVEAPLPGLFRRPSDWLSRFPAVAEGLTSVDGMQRIRGSEGAGSSESTPIDELPSWFLPNVSFVIVVIKWLFAHVFYAMFMYTSILSCYKRRLTAAKQLVFRDNICSNRIFPQ